MTVKINGTKTTSTNKVTGTITGSITGTTSDINKYVALATHATNVNSSYDATAQLDAYCPQVQSLLSYTRWFPEEMTYGSDAVAKSDYANVYMGAETIDGTLTSTYKGADSALWNSLNHTVKLYNAVTSMDLTRNDDNHNINVGSVSTQMGGFTFGIGDGVGGDVFMSNTLDYSDKYGFGQYALTHEMGHAMGLKHSFEPYGNNTTILDTSLDNRVNTVMSYTDYHNVGVSFNSGGGYDKKGIYTDSLMMLDIAALQAMGYGVDTTTTAGNDTYRFDNTAFYHCIWDAGGVDTIDLSATTHSDKVNMNGGTFSDINYRDKATQIADASNYLQHTVGYSKEQADYTASVTINSVPTDQLYTGEKALSLAYGVVIENVKLGSGNDYLYDNKYNNIISGGDGNDTFYMGAGGYDQVDGGNGIDTVVLQMNKSAVTIGKTANDTYIIGDKFSIKMVGVEDVQFTDQLYIV
jgi:hypothetical protein